MSTTILPTPARELLLGSEDKTRGQVAGSRRPPRWWDRRRPSTRAERAVKTKVVTAAVVLSRR